MADTPGGFWSRQLGAYLSGKVQQAPSFLHPEVAQMVQEVGQQAMPAPPAPSVAAPAPTPAPAPEAKQPRIRMTSTQRGELKEFTKNYPEFAKYMSEFQPVNQTADAARQPALVDYLGRNPIPEVRQAAQNTFRPTLQLESPYRFGQQANLANLRNFPSPDPLEFASADRYPLAGTFERNAPQIEPPGVASQRSAGVTSRTYLRNLPSPDPLELASADRLPPVRGAATAGPRAASAGPSMGEQMGKGYVPKGFWEGATERVFQPEPGPPQGIDVNAPDFRAARGLGQAALGIARRRPMDVAIGVGAAGAGIKALYDEYGRQQAEQARPYTLAATLEAARQGRAEPSAAAQPLAAGNILAPVPGSALTTTGNAQRTIAEDMARRTGPEAPFLSSAPGAPITFPTATAAAGAPSVAGRVTPGTGRPGATPGQQRGELDLSDMSFKEAFKTARDKAEQLGVEPTGRFMWRGNAYQTNVGPARGRERYVPESQQTRLGNLPQLADAIAPTPQPASAPAGERITEVLPRSAPVTPAAPTAAAQPQGVLESLPDYAARQKAAQGYLGSRLAAGEGSRDRPIQLDVNAELTPETQRYLERHPEHRLASANPNLQREYVMIMRQLDELGVTEKEIRDAKTTTTRDKISGESLKGTVEHFVPDKFGGHFTGGRFWAPRQGERSGEKTVTGTRTERTDKKSTALDLLADWNRRNEEWNARQEKAEAVKPSAAETKAANREQFLRLQRGRANALKERDMEAVKDYDMQLEALTEFK